ncbi:hypothetical protein CRYO30217_02925 [Parvicella tangerina]|uniref:O-antigen ligase-related domain-containing protein n=2 Tax=Parvicella tangerina TaxID=2829795 RepID=A0A916JQ92_9FLAO|nr:hypothetical protein CRYO30217_02925 [Parvicella tangerina]
MSIGVIAISANWILEGNFKEKWNTLKDRKFLVVIFLLFFLIHVVWGVLSDNFTDVLDDLRRKLPFLALPVTIGTSKKLNQKELSAILIFFLLGLMISSSIGFYKFVNHDYENYRDLSIFISHIRFGLFLGMGVGVALYLFTITQHLGKYLYLLPTIYFLLFIRVLGSGTGYLAGGLALALSLIYIAKSVNKKWVYYGSIALLFLGVFSVGFYTYREYQSFMTPREGVFENPPVYTAQMNLYEHHPELEIYENGYPVFMNYCPLELEESWNKRSLIPIDSLDQKGQIIQGTILRYMTSKGLYKDAKGVAQLTAEDIKNIENGITSIAPPKSGFSARVQESVLEYVMFKNNLNPNGHSLVQRLYYLQAGWHIASTNLLAGVTIGGEEKAYQDYYKSVNSPLSDEHRLKAHNQFLSFFVCFGIIGTLILLFSLVYPIIKTPINFMGILFISLSLIGFFTDDMLNRQAGVTFIALFYSLIFLSGTNLKRDNFIPDTVN